MTIKRCTLDAYRGHVNNLRLTRREISSFFFALLGYVCLDVEEEGARRPHEHLVKLLLTWDASGLSLSAMSRSFPANTSRCDKLSTD